MELKSTFCFLDIGPVTTTARVSSANDAQEWQLVTPPPVRTCTTDTTALLLSGGASAVDEFLLCVAQFSHLSCADHVALLTRTHAATETFYAYVLRWLQAACAPSTIISAMPAALYATRLANADSALVVESLDGVVTCTPVLAGVVAADAVAQWGSLLSLRAADDEAAQTGCWRRFNRILQHAIEGAAAAANSDSTPPCSSDGAAAGAVVGELPFATEVTQHLQLCRQRELHPCLSTVLLCGELATTVEARYGVGILLSFFLPDSFVTWC